MRVTRSVCKRLLLIMYGYSSLYEGDRTKGVEGLLTARGSQPLARIISTVVILVYK